MYMILGMFMLGIVSFVMAITWRRRHVRFTELFIFLRARFEPSKIDLSGRKHYAQCISYKWVMKNIIHRRSRIREALRELMADSTFSTVLVLGSLISFIPIALAYLIVGGLATMGGSLSIALIAILVVQAPFDVAMSYELLSWMAKQDPLEFKESDLAYAEVASNTIIRWTTMLVAAGIGALIYAPWSDPTLELIIFGLSSLFNIILIQFFIPLAIINGAVAYVVFVSVVVLVIVLLILLPGILYGLLKRGEDLFSLDAQDHADDSKQQAIEKEKDTGNH